MTRAPRDPGHAVGVSLWLSPQGPPARRLRRWIEQLAGPLGTPPFPPHVTLLGGLWRPESVVLAEARRLAASLAPLTLRLDRVGQGSAYFRCVHLLPETNAALRRARRLAERHLALPRRRYLPHLSLVYGWLARRQRLELAKELRRELPLTVSLTALDVVRTRGEVDAWSRLARLPLRSGSKRRS